jgi:hypothetical protein
MAAPHQHFFSKGFKRKKEEKPCTYKSRDASPSTINIRQIKAQKHKLVKNITINTTNTQVIN